MGSQDPISEAQADCLFHHGKGGKQAKTKENLIKLNNKDNFNWLNRTKGKHMAKSKSNFTKPKRHQNH